MRSNGVSLVVLFVTGLLLLLVCLVGCGGGPAQPTATPPPPTPSPESSPTSEPGPTPLPTAPVDVSSMPIVGYYPSWGIYIRDYQIMDIPAGRLTHVNYAFANIDPDTGECIIGDIWADDANFRQMALLRQQYPHLKVLIAIGGWTWSGEFSNVALTEASREKFVASCVNRFLIRYGDAFDGIDLDWEFPVVGGIAGSAARPEDKHNYTLLVEEFRRQMDALEEETGREYLLTLAAPAKPATYAHYELDALSQYLDWFNVMTYDYHGSWDDTTNFSAPLNESSGDPSEGRLSVDTTVQGYLEAGVPPEKIMLGVPFYGRGWAGVPDVDHGLYQPTTHLPRGTWEKGIFDYKDLAKNYVAQNDYTRHWHEEAQAPWLYNPSEGIFITFDDPESVALKADYVISHGLGGIMFWELSGDDGSLLDAIYDHLNP
jgi:chitinase